MNNPTDETSKKEDAARSREVTRAAFLDDFLEKVRARGQKDQSVSERNFLDIIQRITENYMALQACYRVIKDMSDISDEEVINEVRVRNEKEISSGTPKANR